jgi:hypothetical protein
LLPPREVLTPSNGFVFGPAEKVRAFDIKESWFFLKLLAATFEVMNLYILKNP